MNVEHISTQAILSALLLSPSTVSADIRNAMGFPPTEEETQFHTLLPVVTLTANEARALLQRREYASQSSASHEALSISDTNDVTNDFTNAENSASLVAELRRLSGLTWAEIASVFGVSKRAPFHWASGNKVSAENHKRLGELVALLNHVDRGSAYENRNLLLGTSVHGKTLLELLKERSDEAFREAAGKGTGRASLPNKLSSDADSLNAPVHWGSNAASLGSEIVEVPIAKSNVRRAKPRRPKT